MKNSNSNEAFEALKIYLIENFDAKVAAGGKEVVKRCHICGDSHDRSSRHMYIGCNKDGVIVYNCFKCTAKGVVDGKFLRDLGCYNTDLISLCRKSNESGSSYNNITSKSIRSCNPILVYRNAEESAKKLNYINRRLGLSLDYNDLARFKIVLNLFDYLNANHVNGDTRYPDIMRDLDMFFMGFLSVDHAYVNMRRLVPEGKVSKYVDTRYVNYNIYNLIDNSRRFYVIPSIINPMYHVTLNIAEGGFDILGVYFNTDSPKDNAIFSSIGGKAYSSIIEFFIVEYGLMNMSIHIYADNDVDNREIYRVKELLRPFNSVIYLHRNTFPGEKDYGVDRAHIVDSVVRL